MVLPQSPLPFALAVLCCAVLWAQAQGWTLEKIKSNPGRRFIKSHANLKQLPVGTAKGLKVRDDSSQVWFDRGERKGSLGTAMARRRARQRALALLFFDDVVHSSCRQ